MSKEDTQFKKGRSGNPGGRPKVDPEVLKILRNASKDAALTLIEIASDKTTDKKTRVMAAERILDRAWGRPHQSTEITGDSFMPFKIVIVKGDENKDSHTVSGAV